MLLHKYYPLETANLILQNFSVRYTPCPEFNDPFEVEPLMSSKKSYNKKERLNLSRLFREINQMLPEHHNAKNFIERTYQTAESLRKTGSSGVTGSFPIQLTNDYYLSYLRSSVGVYCLCGHRRSVLMWSHYADSHKGVCITFNVTPEFTKKCIGKRAHAVIYDQSRIRLNWGSTKLIDLFLHKDRRWSYEREYRCCIPLMELSDFNVKHYSANGMYSKVLTQQLPTGCIAGITLGINFEQNKPEELTLFNALIGKKDNAKIGVEQAIRDSLSYKLGFQRSLIFRGRPSILSK